MPYREQGEAGEVEDPTDSWVSKMNDLETQIVASVSGPEDDVIDRERAWMAIVALVSRLGLAIAMDSERSAPVLNRTAVVVGQLERMQFEEFDDAEE